MHDWTSSLSPTHPLPSNFGGGFVHVLERFCLPPPQETVHGVKLLHSDQFASTTTYTKGNEYSMKGHKPNVARISSVTRNRCNSITWIVLWKMFTGHNLLDMKPQNVDTYFLC